MTINKVAAAMLSQNVKVRDLGNINPEMKVRVDQANVQMGRFVLASLVAVVPPVSCVGCLVPGGLSI